jgi:hypothetical protein
LPCEAFFSIGKIDGHIYGKKASLFIYGKKNKPFHLWSFYFFSLSLGGVFDVGPTLGRGFQTFYIFFHFPIWAWVLRGTSFCLRRSIHVFEWFLINFYSSLKVYGFNPWVYSWLGYQKRMFKFLKTRKDNFGFFLFTSL